MINLKMTVRADCAVSAWSPPQPPTLVRKALAQLIFRAESWPLDKHLPSLVPADIQKKANLPFHQSGLLIGSCPPPSGNITSDS